MPRQNAGGQARQNAGGQAVTIHITGLDKATENIRQAAHLGVDQGLVVAGARGQQLVTDNITSSYLGRPPAVTFGLLANSIAFESVKTVDISRVVIFSQPPAGDYAGYVEAGTGPHFPPPSALVPWVKKKFSVKDEKQALSIAFAVARKIAKRGVSGFGMFARAFAVLDKELAGIFERSIGAALQALGLGK